MTPEEQEREAFERERAVRVQAEGPRINGAPDVKHGVMQVMALAPAIVGSALQHGAGEDAIQQWFVVRGYSTGMAADLLRKYRAQTPIATLKPTQMAALFANRQEFLRQFQLDPHTPEPWAQAAAEDEKFRQRVRRQAKRELDAEERGARDALAFYTEDDLLREAPAPTLVEGLLVLGSLFMVFGPKNVGKTFLTIALGYAIALGQTFLGKQVHRSGDVVLVLAEGGSRLGLRLLAWRQLHKFRGKTDRLHVLKQPVNLLDQTAVEDFIVKVRDWKPVLIVFDTLSRCMPGAVENAAEDMSAAVANLDRIRLAIPDVTVGVIHHPTKASDDVERGAGTMANAIDTVMNCKDADGVLELSSKYTRDLESFVPIEYALESVEIRGIKDPNGDPYTSAVVKLLDSQESEEMKREAKSLEQQILTCIREKGPQSGSTLAEILGKKKDMVLAAGKRLKADGCLVSKGTGPNQQWHISKPNAKTDALVRSLDGLGAPAVGAEVQEAASEQVSDRAPARLNDPF